MVPGFCQPIVFLKNKLYQASHSPDARHIDQRTRVAHLYFQNVKSTSCDYVIWLKFQVDRAFWMVLREYKCDGSIKMRIVEHEVLLLLCGHLVMVAGLLWPSLKWRLFLTDARIGDLEFEFGISRD